MVESRGGAASFRSPGPHRRWRRLLLALLPLVPLAGAPDAAHAGPPDRLAQRLAHLSVAPVAERVQAVNRLFNGLRYTSDERTWGRRDHWTTPDELLERGEGDCEDLAIGKYFALRRLGIPAARLQITYVQDLERRRAHMVLLLRGDDERTVVLDNRSGQVLPLERRRDLVPVYGFNEQQVRVMAPDGRWRAFPHAGRWRIRQWEAVLRRVSDNPAGSWSPLLTRTSHRR